jgi:hypothetical protein
MPQEPFPHILSTSKPQRVVAPDLKVGEVILADPAHPSGVKFKINKILSTRPAKGDWSNWEQHPNHYEVEMKLA